MQVKSLKIFCDTVELRSFSKAADANGVSQSNASHVVHQLEDRLGVQLIDRSTRPFELTAEGQRYYDGCRGIVRRYFDLEREVRSLREAADSRVTVASIFSVGFSHMNKCLQAFRDDHAGVDVRMEYLHPPRVYAAVESNEADLGIVGHAEPSRQLGVIPWRDERLTVVAAPSHRLASCEAIQLNELDGERFVAVEQGLKLREAIDKEFNQRSVAVEVAAEFDNIETIKRAVEAEEGVTILPEPTVAREIADGTLVPIGIEGKPMMRPLGFLFRRDEAMSEAAEQFVAHFRACAGHADGGGEPPPTADSDADAGRISSTVSLARS